MVESCHRLSVFLSLCCLHVLSEIFQYTTSEVVITRLLHSSALLLLNNGVWPMRLFLPILGEALLKSKFIKDI